MAYVGPVIKRFSRRGRRNIGGTMDKTLLGFCGYRCDVCPAYVDYSGKIIEGFE